MGKICEWLVVACVCVVLSSIILGADYCAVHGNPDMDTPEPCDSITWRCPYIYDGGLVTFHRVVTTPGISEEDVREIMDNPLIPRRALLLDYGNALPHTCISYGLEDTVNSIRQAIAESESHTKHRYTDEDIVVVLRNFLTGIEYEYDDIQYGCVEYWATPMETLYSGKGDCDDCSILFVALGRALGLDTAFIVSAEHLQGGVRLADSRDYPTVEGYTIVECCLSRNTPLVAEDDEYYEGSRLITDGTESRIFYGLTSYVRACGEWECALLRYIL